MKQKLVFISNMAAPYQVKFCYALQEYFDAEFWFYEHIDKTRPDWWKIELGTRCKIMKLSGKLPVVGYFSFGLFKDLLKFKPDIIILGGFMKWHFVVYKLARLLKIKVAIMTEPIRYVKNDDFSSGSLLNKNNAHNRLKIARRLFGQVDLYIGMGDLAARQLIEEFSFPIEKVAKLSYPQDIEVYFNHPLRDKRKGGPITLLFANRLVERYQPLLALEVFKNISSKYPSTRMLMNAEGSLKAECIRYIKRNNLINVEFLDRIDSWDDMHMIYRQSDILVLPATYSNGNGTIIEARASGMGIVISNQINNIQRHSKHGENCFICNLSIDEFVEAVSTYIDNPELLKSHGKLSRQLVQYRKNDHTAKTYFEIFKDYGLVD